MAEIQAGRKREVEEGRSRERGGRGYEEAL